MHEEWLQTITTFNGLSLVNVDILNYVMLCVILRPSLLGTEICASMGSHNAGFAKIGRIAYWAKPVSFLTSRISHQTGKIPY